MDETNRADERNNRNGRNDRNGRNNRNGRNDRKNRIKNRNTGNVEGKQSAWNSGLRTGAACPGRYAAALILLAVLAALMLGGCARLGIGNSDEDAAGAGQPAAKETKEEGFLEQGMTALEAGSYEEALTLLSQAVEAAENLELSWRGIGIARMGKEDYEGAIEAFDKALSEAGADAQELEYDIVYYKASCMLRLDRVNEALELYNNLEAYKPEAATYVGRGAVYAKMGNMDMARADFDKALSEDGKNYDRYIEIFRILETAGRTDIGQEYLKQALDINKESGKNNLEKGKVYYYLEQYDKARTELEKIKSDREPESLLYLARVYEALGDPAYAQTLYREYLDNDSTDGTIYSMIAVSEIGAGDYQGALTTLQEGIQNAVYGKKELYRNEIAAYEYLLDFTTARTKMEEYLASYPEDEEAAREYIFLKSRSE